MFAAPPSLSTLKTKNRTSVYPTASTVTGIMPPPTPNARHDFKRMKTSLKACRLVNNEPPVFANGQANTHRHLHWTTPTTHICKTASAHSGNPPAKIAPNRHAGLQAEPAARNASQRCNSATRLPTKNERNL
ncbi:hypothetical protein HPB48_013423 [Haemaphysalis longicornis]|uniref:Uncharacterized protein n=1 Tax=Haemaphysalis longicornis TaxID=44386 RepID=A0A9J6FCU3_HAELO|nr:hypothetical protein HPB48_013423 [Haemaphysalis longicornis]